VRPLPFLHRPAAAPRAADLQQLAAVRTALAQGLPAYLQQIHRYARDFDQTIELQVTLTYRLRGIDIPPTGFSLHSGTLPHLRQDLELALARLSRTSALAGEFEQLQVRRVALGLEISSRRPEANVATTAGGSPRLLAASRMLEQLAPSLDAVERRRRVLAILAHEHLGLPNISGLREAMDGEALQLRSELKNLRFAMAAEGPQPELGGMTLVQFCLPYLPGAQAAAADLLATASLAADRLLSIYVRILGQLAAVVEDVERDLGLAPIAWPALPAATGSGAMPALPGNAPPAAWQPPTISPADAARSLLPEE
jgi:hypothetical protein